MENVHHWLTKLQCSFFSPMNQLCKSFSQNLSSKFSSALEIICSSNTLKVVASLYFHKWVNKLLKLLFGRFLNRLEVFWCFKNVYFWEFLWVPHFYYFKQQNHLMMNISKYPISKYVLRSTFLKAINFSFIICITSFPWSDRCGFFKVIGNILLVTT